VPTPLALGCSTLVIFKGADFPSQIPEETKDRISTRGIRTTA
jgi:hypothetical protein